MVLSASDVLQVAKGILGLTKLNYNSGQLGEGRPITVKYSERVGEILLANPGLPPSVWKHNFKNYAQLSGRRGKSFPGFAP